MKEIYATCRVVGFHNWQEAPEKYAYLRDRHRHEFVIKAYKKVSHNEREVEINHLKQNIEEYLHQEYGNPCEFGGQSCETIAQSLIEEFHLSMCDVSEDGFNGAVIRRAND